MSKSDDGEADPGELKLRCGDECPNCHCGTLEETDEELLCRGECGEVWEKIPDPDEEEDA